MRSATPTSSTCSTPTRARLRNDLAAVSSPSASATRTEPPRCASSRPAALAADRAAHAAASSTWIVLRSACTESAARSAARRALRLTLTTYLRGLGPKTVPPPVQIGEREVPARARPVPFWRQGFAEPPDTIPRVLVAWVPCRRAASSATTTSCTSGPLKGWSNTSAGSSTAVPPPSAGALGIGAHLHGGALRARHGAAHQHQ